MQILLLPFYLTFWINAFPISTPESVFSESTRRGHSDFAAAIERDLKA